MAAAGSEMSSNTESGKSYSRRDRLLEIEGLVQEWWKEKDVFRADSLETPPNPGEKFFGNFPFPYMNGYLHLGHAFSLSKLEFAAAYHRLRGANVLLPFAFHCTGMPIKASADKLCREIQKFGNPPAFHTVEEEKNADPDPQPDESDAGNQGAPDKFKGKKSKAAAKSGGDKYQWEIMQSYGLSDDEISKFQDPYYWLTYFPPLAVEDLKAFGLGCDWRRTFITTDMNPFFDRFVRWQMRKLKKLGKIVKDLRYTIYSPLDGQPCADHDRASGEGVLPQEYTLIKMEVVPPLPQKLSVLADRKVYLAAATLRPETMYGQTNAWVLPQGKYGAFEINETDVFILTYRAALNLAYQKLSRVPEKPSCLVELTGNDLIGLPLRSPLAFNEVIYSLPMLSILTDKGTGIVTSVPSDSPDDFMSLHDLKSKPAFRAKFGVKDEWILPFDVIPIINTPEFGDKPAEKVCVDMKIKSQNERQKLEEAKKKIYKGGFYEGTMLVGEYAGMRVQEAKNLIRSRLLELGEAVMYSEPEKKVISRSGDECVVALTDQWYITYGEPNWRQEAEDCLAAMNLFSDETRHGFEHTLSWLNQWACSRNFGLGTRIPWDEEFLVESLSDSTLYMAYYTVCHLLQKGDMYGSDTSSVKPEQLTDEVWEFLFCGGPYPKSSDISSSLLNKMKQEFEYWYPFDLRVSGKDLIQNHLTFCIYNHTALLPKHHWPQGFRCNGHIMLNSEKMSKSTGNFRTLRQAMEEFSADATRFSLADAGDGMDDANFVFETANAAILRLTKEITWMEELLAAESSLRSGPPSTYYDHVFANEINIAVGTTEKNYSEYLFREALKTGFYDLQAARDEYRFSCGTGGMNRDLLWQFMDVQTRLLAPIWLKLATKCFNSARVIGNGAFGTVYKGILQETGDIVAVKRCSHTGQGRAEFLSELSIIGNLRHRNLVRLQGWCHEKGEILLVYDFMPNGSLDKALFESRMPLPWSHRRKILAGVASALAYLHQECENQVIHRDVKTSNIMLDEGFNAKLGDFGLARQIEHDKSPDATVAAGTMGYLAPEYLLTGRATEKTDVFSFGAVVLGDILSNGGPMQEMAHIAKGQDHGNCVSLLRASAMNANQSSMLILQETCIDAAGSLVVYAPVDIPAMHVVMNGGDSAYVALLPSGFAIVPDGPGSRGAAADNVANGGAAHRIGGGSLLTVAFQILVNSLPTAKLTVESVETVNNLISCTVQKIKAALQCES